MTDLDNRQTESVYKYISRTNRCSRNRDSRPEQKKEIEKVRIGVRVKVIFTNLYGKKFASLP